MRSFFHAVSVSSLKHHRLTPIGRTLCFFANIMQCVVVVVSLNNYQAYADFDRVRGRSKCTRCKTMCRSCSTRQIQNPTYTIRVNSRSISTLLFLRNGPKNLILVVVILLLEIFFRNKNFIKTA